MDIGRESKDDVADGTTIHPQARAIEPGGATPRSEWIFSKASIAIGILASAAVLVALGYWTYQAVERSLKELRGATLSSQLDAQVKTLGLWIENHKIDIRRLARDEQVRAGVQALVAIAARSGASEAEYCASPLRRPLVEQVGAALEGKGAVAFNAIDRAGRIVASRFREYCGLAISPDTFGRQLEDVFRGETRFVRPYRDELRFVSPPAVQQLTRPVTWVETPVRDDQGRIIAALGFGEYADGQFAAILAAARPGASGEVYAFDEQGVMLSDSRFTQELVRREILPPGVTAPLALELREPNGARPYTRLAQAAIAGADDPEQRVGLLLEPYRSYRGSEVIGAWRWLPEYNLGVAMELDADEAYAPLRYLRIAFGVVFGALVVAVIVALVTGISVLRLRQQIGESRKLGAYEIERRIDEGGMAIVYLAHHALLKRPTAVKLLKPARATDEMIARFEREVRLASTLSHPNTIEIFDYGRTRDGLFYYAMEYLDGLTVAKLVERGGALPVARVIHLLRQMCAGLAEAHARGLVHRDIKPENIMVCRYGGELDFVKILDFGLVKSLSEQHSRDLTRTLRLLGTPLYMAPERLRDPADVDGRADIYAVGAVAYLMLTGKKLFESSDDLSLTSKVLNEEPVRLSAAATQHVPRELELLVMACLEKRREDRPQRVTDLTEALDALAAEHRWTPQDAAASWPTDAPEAQPKVA